MIYGLYSLFKTPPPLANWLAIVGALFLAGFYLWRADHIRLMPKFEAHEVRIQDSPTADKGGNPTGSSTLVQLLPKCLTDAEIENCQGHLRRILRWSYFNNRWEETEMNETVLLHWSHEDEAPVPITLHPGIERRLNVFYVRSGENVITPKVSPMPLRAADMFRSLEPSAFLFDIKITAKDCPDVDVLLRVEKTHDPARPVVEIADVKNCLLPEHRLNA